MMLLILAACLNVILKIISGVNAYSIKIDLRACCSSLSSITRL